MELTQAPGTEVSLLKLGADVEDAGADENTCAVCLEQIQPENLAIVKDCGHCYCGELELTIDCGFGKVEAVQDMRE